MGFSAASALLGDVKRDRILNLLSAENLLGWVDNVRSLSRGRNRPASASHKLLHSRAVTRSRNSDRDRARFEITSGAASANRRAWICREVPN